jgi:hypothetical protein
MPFPKLDFMLPVTSDDGGRLEDDVAFELPGSRVR